MLIGGTRPSYSVSVYDYELNQLTHIPGREITNAHGGGCGSWFPSTNGKHLYIYACGRLIHVQDTFSSFATDWPELVYFVAFLDEHRFLLAPRTMDPMRVGPVEVVSIAKPSGLRLAELQLGGSPFAAEEGKVFTVRRERTGEPGTRNAAIIKYVEVYDIDLAKLGSGTQRND